MRKVSAVVSIVGIVFLCASPLLAKWQRVIHEDGSGWQVSVEPIEHWTSAEGAESPKWQPVRVGTPASYPESVEPADQYRWPFIWSQEPVEAKKAVYFRRTIHLDALVQSARVQVCAYGTELVVYLNGEKLIETGEMGALHTIDLTERLKPGPNIIAAAVVRGEKNFGLLVMGEAEVQWPMLQYSRVAVGHQMPPMESELWKPCEEGLALEWEGTSYPTIQPEGGMAEYSTAHFMMPLTTGEYLPFAAALRIAGDDSYEVKVNGKVAAVQKCASRSYMPVTVDISDYLSAGGHNIITARVTNDWGPGRIHLLPSAILLF
ncbi:MAG: hypothetical protein R6V19_07180 [Armatimonadota bacterium]